MLDHALQYAARQWRVFRLTGFKTPLKGSHGHLDATTDRDVITRWWQERPRANIGLATGDLVVLDADGPGGLDKFKEMIVAHGGMAPTLTAQTSRGFHFYFTLPPGVRLRSRNAKRDAKGADGLDIKADGGFVVLPPSVNAKTGFVYRWALDVPPAIMPDWLIAWCQEQSSNRQGETKASPRRELSTFGERPAWLQRADSVQDLTSRVLRAERQAELPELLAALKVLGADPGYDRWFELGAAIHDYDPSTNGLAIFQAWSRSSERHQDQADAACERKWVEYGKSKPGKALITKASIYALADQAIKEQKVGLGSNNNTPDSALAHKNEVAGEFGQVPGSAGEPSVKQANGSHSFQTAFNAGHGNGSAGAAGQAPGVTAAMLTPIQWADKDARNKPQGTTTNTAIALRALGVCCQKDAFHEKLIVGGHPIAQWAGDLSDDVVIVLRQLIKESWGFDPGERNMRDAAVGECLQNQFDPVLTYLDGLQWDGVGRLGGWVCSHLGAPRTPLNQEVGRLMLLAAVRRARVPGCKFDQIIALEGKEGTGKSSAIKILAGEENFSDQHVLGASDREQQEAVTGVWLHEIAELTGMRRADVERIKHFASRTEDRARPAYGRFRKDVRRRCIFIATTNESSYLKSDTGNRRFWPIETGHIDLQGLARDRDQLWAEASMQEKKEREIVLRRDLWAEAAEMQHSRMEYDIWEDSLAQFFKSRAENAKRHGIGMADSTVSVYEVLTSHPFNLKEENLTQMAQNRVARALHKIGYEKYRARDGSQRSWRYRRLLAK